jgi:hypothetical protein
VASRGPPLLQRAVHGLTRRHRRRCPRQGGERHQANNSPPPNGREDR